jgi:outer membrane protein assembly factor BamB
LFCGALLTLAPLPAEDWEMYLKDLAHSSFNPSETQIAAATVSRLESSWVAQPGGSFAAAPTISGGVAYIGDWDGNFHAIEIAGGAVLWTRYVGVSAPPQRDDCQPAIGVTSQATVDETAVYVGGGDSAVYALDKRTGAVIWRTQLADPESGSYIWSSMVLNNGALYLGVASLGDCPLVRGQLVRIDLRRPGRPLVRWLAPPGQVGGGICATPAIDAGTDTVFVTTGTGEQDPDSGLFGGALAAFDADTLELQAYFLLPSNSTNDDIEWGSSPTLFTTSGGAPMVAATGKDGVLYALSRHTLELSWSLPVAIGCGWPELGCGSLSTPAFDGSTLYVGAGAPDPNGSAVGSVWALSPDDGSILWEQDLDGVVIAPVTVASQLVYVGTTAGLYVFEAGSGDLLWDDHTGALYSQPVVSDGALYCSFVEGDLVAWRVSADAKPAAAGRPARKRP